MGFPAWVYLMATWATWIAAAILTATAAYAIWGDD